MKYVALLIALGAFLPAVELTIVALDEPIRPDLPWRCHVQVAHAEADAVVAMTLRAGTTSLATSSLTVADGDIDFAVVPPAISADEVQLVIACAGTIAERSVPTLAGLRRRVIAVSERLGLGPTASPLTRLRLGQALALLLTSEHPTLNDCQRATALIGAVERQDPAGENGALIDPYDDSVQPVRIIAPSAPPVGIAMWLRHQPVSGPERWPAPPAAAVAAARAAGWWLIEPYPAGDLNWIGAGRRRLDTALALARTQGAGALPLAVIGEAEPARLTTWPAAPAIRAQIPDTGLPEWFANLATITPIGGRSGQTSGLGAYVAGAFRVIVGTGEHRAAADANARLAAAFSAAWVAHAHSRVEVHQDTEPKGHTDVGTTLIFIGNPRSNATLAKLDPKLPVRWDERSLTWMAPDGSPTTWLRGERRAVGFASTLADGTRVVVLDGDWTFPPGTAPLGDLDAQVAIGDGKDGWVVLR